MLRKFLTLSGIILVLFGCSKGRDKKMPGNWIPVKRVNLPAEVIATGTVVPRVGAYVKVGPRISGKLEKLYVKVGDRVQKGQTLAIVEHKDLMANVKRNEAAKKEAEANLEWAKANYERLKKLYSEGIATIDELDLAKKSLDLAQAQLESATSQLEYSKVQLSYATVTAPISGIIGTVSTQEGETVAASFSAPTFVTILNLDELEVDAYVDEVDIGKIKVGQKASFTVDAYPEKVFKAEVEAIYPDAEIRDNVVYYAVILRIEKNFEEILRPQMTASVTIHLEELQDVLAIPSKAIKKENGNSFVMLKEGEKIIKRQITTGRESGDMVEVRSGLSQGDLVLVQAQRQSEQGL
ncbi:MAG: efflux RND transporter periplasmic adaptor subunit [Thermoanaerobaculia bacterium]